MKTVVVGTGFIGPVHVEGLKRAGVDVLGVVGSSPSKTKAACAELGLPKVYASFDEVIQDPEVDVVHLATPNRLHFEQAQAVLQSGKHVLCEKPLAMNSGESSKLVELAAASGKVAGVAYNIRFYPLCHEVAARVRNDDFGKLLHVHGSYVQDWLLYESDFNWRVSAEEGGALRAVADIGTHWLDLVQFVSGKKVSRLFADLQTVHPVRQQPLGGVETFSGKDADRKKPETSPVEIDTEDAANLLLQFEDGMRGALTVSQTIAGRKNCLRFELAGSKSSCHWNSEKPNQLWIGHRDQANEILVRDPSLVSETAGAISNYPGGHNEGFPDTFKQLFKTFYGYIEAGDFSATEPFPTFAEGHREVVLCEAVLKSHRDQAWVDINE